jgi:cytochrome P450
MATDETRAGERGVQASDRPPGPDGLPLVGNTVSFLQDPLAFYAHCADDFESDVVSYQIGRSDGYMLTDPAYIEQVLVTDHADYHRGNIINDTLGEIADGGLFLLEDEAWQKQRQALQPAFYRDRIESYAEVMVEFAARGTDDWRDGEAVTLTDEMPTLTLDVLAKTLLDIDIEGEESTIGAAARAITDRFDAGSLSAFLPLWVPTPANRRCNRAVEQFDAQIAGVIANREQSDREFDDLLSILRSVELEDGSGLSDQEIRDELFTFLFAGHETTALALTYTFCLLANNPAKQAKLHDELDVVLDGERPTAASLFELDYLGKVVDESLRLYPPAYTVFREPLEDVQIGGYEIDSGSVLSMPQWVVHRDERWYDDPDEFRPERWTDEFENDLPDYAYYPFGGGPRHCIGMRFALMEAKLAVATVAQRYRLEPGTELPLDLSMQLTLKPSNPVDVVVERR